MYPRMPLEEPTVSLEMIFIGRKNLSFPMHVNITHLILYRGPCFETCAASTSPR